MKTKFLVRDIDYLALLLMIGLVAVANDGAMDLPKLFLISALVGIGCLFYFALRAGQVINFAQRLLAAIVIFGVLHFLKFIPVKQIASVVFYLFLFVLFSSRQTRGGASLRAVCGIFSSIALTLALPKVVGLPLAIILAFMFIGALISIWSGMTLSGSLIWFAKRSVRKETVFLILFLTGISAIGLRQAQDYAGRQSELSGISHIISPGNMNNLLLSPAIAMRVKFGNKVNLPLGEAYFRGTVMDRFLGFNWGPGVSRLRPMSEGKAGDIQYQVAISPRYGDFVPVLDYGVIVRSDDPSQAPYSARNNGVFQGSRMSDSWQYYTAISRGEPNHSLDSEDAALLLQVPGSVDQGIKDLALKLRKGGSVSEFVSRFAGFIQDGGFRYSLNPSIKSSSLRDFILLSKEGACEHYASAGAGLARLAGIPARVVAGFLGGVWDAAGTTLFLRDLDAHAWVELWDEELQKWTRFDPVAFVASDRISLGAESYLRSIGVDIPDEVAMREKLFYASFFMELDNFIASLNGGLASSMATNVVDYGEEIALVGAFGLLVSFIILRVRRFYSERKSPELRLMMELNSLLNRFELGKNHGEPINIWAGRVQMRYNVIADELDVFSEAYNRYVYAQHRNRRDVSMMENALRVMKSKIRAMH